MIETVYTNAIWDGVSPGPGSRRLSAYRLSDAPEESAVCPAAAQLQ